MAESQVKVLTLLYSKETWRRFNLAQDQNEIFGADSIWRSGK